MRIKIVDMGMITALGQGVDKVWQALMAGQSGLAPVKRFKTDAYVTNLAGCIPELDPETEQSRLDTLIDLLFKDVTVPSDCHLFTSSTKAGIDQLERTARKQPSSCNRLLGSQVAGALAEKLNINGPRQNLSAACASATAALTMAGARIARGQADAVLVCGLDVVSEFIFSGFSALKALSPQICRPFDANRDGLNLGEGGAYVLLMSDERCQKEGRTALGELIGWAIAGDANHITAPSREGEGLILAVNQALDVAGLNPSDISGISAHGTGSIYNDAMELTAFSKIFGSPIPLHSVKGATGHTMGASGAIETILALQSLKHQTIPPTVGLQEPDEPAQAWVSPESQSFDGNYLLNTNSGFGGINAAVILTWGGDACI